MRHNDLTLINYIFLSLKSQIKSQQETYIGGLYFSRLLSYKLARCEFFAYVVETALQIRLMVAGVSILTGVYRLLAEPF